MEIVDVVAIVGAAGFSTLAALYWLSSHTAQKAAQPCLPDDPPHQGVSFLFENEELHHLSCTAAKLYQLAPGRNDWADTRERLRNRFPEIPKRDDQVNDDFLFTQGPTRGLGKIQFHDYMKAYSQVDLPNVNIFKEQIEALKTLLMTAPPSKEQTRDIDFLLCMGELFTLVAYGQLIIEKGKMDGLGDDLLEQIFDFMVRDFSKFALQLYAKTSSTEAQMEGCLKMIRKPVVDEERFQRVWQKEVLPLTDTYEMNP